MTINDTLYCTYTSYIGLCLYVRERFGVTFLRSWNWNCKWSLVLNTRHIHQARLGAGCTKENYIFPLSSM